ncbi:hypothetical protein GOBAR_AA00645 [Gossypium barbadense]|uniref:Uncharacterized protein n=1 Tax=Gossypium barbadense TaxID=3634 RepID=A0A2P5YWF3_GOSBA|nr:hypothetical protein GOBAR_AA00645 [Gossypium barbadense]
MNESTKAMMRVKEDTPVLVEVGFHKYYAKRILYLKLAIVVVEQGMKVVENLSQWSFKFLSNMVREVGVAMRCGSADKSAIE